MASKAPVSRGAESGDGWIQDAQKTASFPQNEPSAGDGRRVVCAEFCKPFDAMEMDAPSATSRPETLAAGIVTPIAQLAPGLSDQDSRVVRGEVTVVWPYSLIRKSFAFVIAEPDVRLRDSSGQIRLQIDGAIAKLVAESGLESGDEILLSLAGAGWAANTYEARIPGSCSNWQLEYTQKITLEIKSSLTEDTKVLDLTNPPSTETGPASEPPIVEAPSEDFPIAEEPSVTSPVQQSSHVEFHSPAFIKRARLSYGSLFEPDHDPFAEDDGGVKGKGRKRARFGRYSASWRYASHSPSPEPSDAGVEEDPDAEAAAGTDDSPSTAAPAPKSSEPTMVDEGCQVVESNLASDEASIDRPVASPAEKTTTDASVPDPPVSFAPTLAPESAQMSTGNVEATVPSTFETSTLFGRFESSNGDYSVPRFQTDISDIHSGPSIEEQVRFGFHHSPSIPLAPQGTEVEHSQPFPQAHGTEQATPLPASTGAEASGMVQDLPPVPMSKSHDGEAVHQETIPLWNVSNEQILNPAHADAELPIDPSLTAALDADGPDTELGTPSRTALPTEVNLYGSYNENRYQNEAENEMVEQKIEGGSVSSEESMNPDEAEYERELANESYDDYDMRNYADVEDDIEGPHDNVPPEGEDEEGNYYSDGSEGQEEEEEEYSEDDESDGESQEMSAPKLERAPQQTGPVVIDLLSDSSDDESDPPPRSVSIHNAEPQRDIENNDVGQESHLVAQTSQPSPPYDIHSEPSNSEPESELEGSGQSEEDAEGEDDELAGFESPVRSIVQTEPEPEASQMPAVKSEPEQIMSSSRHATPEQSNKDSLKDAKNEKSSPKTDQDVEMTVPMMSGALFPTAADEMQQSIETVEETGGEGETDVKDEVEDSKRSSRPPGGESEPDEKMVSSVATPSSPIRMSATSEQPNEPAMASDPADAITETGRLPTPTGRQTPQIENTAQSEEQESIQAAQTADTEQVLKEDDDNVDMVEVPMLDSGSPLSTVVAALEQKLEENIVVEKQSEIAAGEPDGVDLPSEGKKNETVCQAVVSVDIEQVTISKLESVETTQLSEGSGAPEKSVATTVEDTEVTVEGVEIVAKEDDIANKSPGPDPASPASSEIEHVRGQSLSSVRSNQSRAFATQIPPSESGYVNDDLLTDTQENDMSEKPDGQGVQTEMDGVEAGEPEASAALPSEHKQSPSHRFASQEPTSDDVDMVDAGSASEDDSAAEVENESDHSEDGDFVEAPESIKDAAGAAEDDESKSLSQDDKAVEDEEIPSSPVLSTTHEIDNEDGAKGGSSHVEEDNEDEKPEAEEVKSVPDEAAAGSLQKEEIRVDIRDDFKVAEIASDSEPRQVDDAPDEDQSISDVNEESSPVKFGGSDDSRNVSEAEDGDESEEEASAAEQTPTTRATRSANKQNDTKAARAAYKPSKSPELDPQEISSDSEPEQASTRITRGALRKDIEQTPSVRSRNTPQPDNVSELAAEEDSEPSAEPPSTRVTRASRKNEPSDTPRAARPVTRATKTKQAPTKAEEKADKVKTTASDADPSVRLAKGAVNKKGPVEQPQERADIIDGDPSIRLARSAAGNKRKQPAEPAKPVTGTSDGDPSLRLARGAAASKRKQPPEPVEPSVAAPDADPSVRLARAAGNKRKRVPDQLDVSAPAAKNRMTTRSASSSFRRSASPAVTEDPSVRLAKGALNSPSRRQKHTASADAHARTETAPSTSNNSNQIKTEVTRRLREDLPDYQTLLRVPKMVGKTVDLLVLATTEGTKPTRTKARQYCMSFNVTDASISSRVYEVQLYRLHKESLPIVKPGDRVLLRDFNIVALTDRGWGLRSVEKSSYAVFDDADDAHDGEDAAEPAGGMPQIRGPPVELTAADHEVAKLLKEWWSSLDDGARDRLDKQNKKLAAGS
ncbi:hypothetical protein PpBr36_01617 [Pyricularia pennisetigena]|uniref:hypothetical protein n=1 Tax=Pyricularia pennisetigena TaxID=1578925 RepID=UPI0011538632|nr:hypothetical protein PpBr36_01617 [Pyricularia pennisetigena]TLS28962.1 hypothetical protein PpBr36_01617 [Pyricularia pennisetigena]